MVRNKTYDDCCRIIWQLVRNKTNPILCQMTELSYDLRMPYSSIRKIMKFDFPHCFEEAGYPLAWRWTGEAPIKGVPFNGTPPPVETARVESPTPVETIKANLTGTGRQSGWVWNQDALRFLDKLFPGQTFAEVLQQMYAQGRLSDLEVIGKTIARAANQMTKTGQVPYL